MRSIFRNRRDRRLAWACLAGLAAGGVQAQDTTAARSVPEFTPPPTATAEPAIAAGAGAGEFTVVAGGASHQANGPYGVIGGGLSNRIHRSGATVAGGIHNTAGSWNAAVGGGRENAATGLGAVIAGGRGNTASDRYSAVLGGYYNSAAGAGAVVGGGFGNAAGGLAAAVPGGSANEATGDYSLAAGRRAKATHPGSFVWADATDADAGTTRANEFVVRASGGVRIAADPTLAAGVALAPGAGAWSTLSDRAAKEHLQPANPRAVLEALTALPIWTWNYRTQPPAIRHLGPIAQEFQDAFGLGENDTHISTVDIQGVALAAIQGLHAIVREKEARIAALERENRTLADRLDALEQTLRPDAGRAPAPPAAE